MIMNTALEKDKAAKLAIEYFGNGYHCAEAVAAAVFDAMNEDGRQALAHACAFGGGFGESFKEVCGVLCGSLIVIGHFHARTQRGESWKEAAKLGAEATRRFVALHGTSNCGELRRRFGEEYQMDRCRDLVKQGVESLSEILSRHLEDAPYEGAKSTAECSACS
jgi:C_GCAxxG_C_C family probable redox protein